MAEENRGTEQVEREGNGRVSSAAAPASTAQARQAIDQTRGRISATLDAIEGRLDAKKERLKDRADVLRPVRHRIRMHVWPSVGIAFATGLLLSGLGGRKSRKSAEGSWMSKADRRERRRWRAERRARLHLPSAEPAGAPSPPAHGAERSPLDDFGRKIAGAVADGLKQRAASR